LKNAEESGTKRVRERERERERERGVGSTINLFIYLITERDA